MLGASRHLFFHSAIAASWIAGSESLSFHGQVRFRKHESVDVPKRLSTVALLVQVARKARRSSAKRPIL
jgi:hypothetical protein